MSAGFARQPLVGGVQVQRTFYARGQTGQQLLIGAYQSLSRQVAAGTVKIRPPRDARTIIVDDRTRIVARNMVTGAIEPYLATWSLHRRLRQRVLPVDERDGLNAARGVRTARRVLANPATQITDHPGVRRHAVKLTPRRSRWC